jgi:hypothetical protein
MAGNEPDHFLFLFFLPVLYFLGGSLSGDGYVE